MRYSGLVWVYRIRAENTVEKIHGINITGLSPGRKRLVATVGHEPMKANRAGASRLGDTPALCG
jgi:hypothetical protein